MNKPNVLGALFVSVLFWTAAPLTDSPVADAAMRGDSEAVRSLLREGADVSAAQGDGMTALHWAAERGSVEMAEMLVYAGAHLEAVTRLGDYTPLHLASKGGHGSVVLTLVEAGCDAHAITSTGGATPLHFAAASGSAEAVTALLEHGADVNAKESVWGQTPLMFAAAFNRGEAITALMQMHADVALTASVVDIAKRQTADRLDQQRRNQRVAALQAAASGLAAMDRPGSGPPGPPYQQGQAGQQQRRQQGQQQRGQQIQRRGEREAGQQQDQQPLGLAPQEQLRGGTEIDPLSYADLIGKHGGLTALLLAARDANVEAVQALLDGGADINQVSAGDHTSPMLMAALNGHYDLVKMLLDLGADPTVASDAGATPLYATLNVEWGPKSRHPQPTDYLQQQITYLELMEDLLNAGADPNARLKKTLWYTTYNNDLLRVDRTGAAPFWRAAYATDVAAMKLMVSYGAEQGIPTTKVPERRFRFGRSRGPREDFSGLPPVPVGAPAVYPIHAASGAGYGQGYAANSHRHVPDGWVPAVKYLVEEHGADVNARDLNGYSPVHHAAARGDNELILYLVEQGADVTFVSRRGQTTVDMANGPYQRIQPFPETVALLESLGAKNNHNCVSC